MTGKVTEKIKQLLEDEVAALGYQLWGCIYSSSKQSALLRVLIDKPGGVTLADCEKATRQISAVLDVDDPIKSAYRLEVSSPGLDRPLFELTHYQQYIGKKIKLRLHVPKEGQRNFVGILICADNEQGIVIAGADQELRVSLNDIDRANLEPEFL